MKLLEFRNRFLRVNKCIACGGMLDFEHLDRPLCEDCRLRWNRAKLEECPRCYAPACECDCMPKLLSRAGALCLHRLVFYRGENPYAAESGVIYTHKRKKASRTLEFLSEQLVHMIRKEMDVLGLDGTCFLLTFVPRSKRSYRCYGFDHSEALCEAISKKLGIEYKRIFDTRLFARVQKQLGAAARLKNVKKSLYAVDSEGVEGKYVLLIDDIVTTGSSMSVCTKHLQKMGCRGVLCFVIASKV